MAAPAPVEVGAQGTVGSLVLREVEYFRRMEAGGGHGNGKKSSSKVAASGGGGGSPRSNGKPKQKQHKQKGGAGNAAFLPRMCSSAEVVDCPSGGRRERPARVWYRPLGKEGDALPLED